METFNIVSTAFPYANSVPHLGNLTQVLKADLYTKLLKSYHDCGWCKTDTRFLFSFHATGLPIYVRLKTIRSKLRELFKSKGTLQKIEFRKHLVKKLIDYFKVEQLSPLLKFLDSVTELLTLKGWIGLIAKYYTKIFLDLNIKTNLPQYHTTTALDQRYSNFVNFIYNQLNEKGLLKEDLKHLIVCDRCHNVLGDHDRIKYEGIGVSKVSVKKHSNTLGELYYFLDPLETHWISLDSKHFIAQDLFEYFKYKTFKEESLVLYEKELLNILLDFKKETFFKSISLESVFEETTLYWTLKAIQCRCGGLANISAEKTYFVLTEDPTWKSKTLDLIEKSYKEKSIHKETYFVLKASLANLRNLSFLRSKGYGTSLELLKGTPYETQIVDSLMDSMIHPYFYSVFLSNQETYKETVSLYRYVLHNMGKDLIQNHYLFFYMFSVLLFPNLPIPGSDTTRFICAKNQLKMSKSLKNVLYWDKIKLNVKPKDLRCYLASLADTSEPTSYDETKIINEGSIASKHYEEILKCKTLKYNRHTCDQINHLLYKIYYLVGGLKEDLVSENLLEFKENKFRLRKVYNLLFNDLRNLLKSKDSFGSQTIDFNLIENLLKSFMD